MAYLKKKGGETRNQENLASDVLMLVHNLNEYEDVEAHVELLAKIIKRALEDAGRETIDE